eukprot:TRINITY_DN77850_c0_g1_i1.p1 TRINITY_DN77850_c0_g1~~TRINITY_DN77850_c0_g1_i1.p1  ORF type:complete len:302 (+),score=79.89 TRINITY_DN77850_c0_g1_i1:138-1043(+)
MPRLAASLCEATQVCIKTHQHPAAFIFGAVSDALTQEKLDEVPQDEWPDPFFKKRSSLTRMAGKAKDMVKDFLGAEDDSIGAEDLEPKTEEVKSAALDAAQAAWSADRASRLGLLRMSNAAASVAETDRAWHAALKAFRFAQAQRQASEFLDELGEQRQQAADLIQRTMKDAHEVWKLSQQGQPSMADQKLKDAERTMTQVHELLPQIQDKFEQLHEAQVKLSRLEEGARALPLYPPRDKLVAETPEKDQTPNPETALDDLWPEEDSAGVLAAAEKAKSSAEKAAKKTALSSVLSGAMKSF